MLIEKSIISEKLKKVKGLASVKIGDAQGVLIANGAIRARDKVMSVELKMPEAEGTSFVLPVKAIDYINSLPEGAVEITEEAERVRIKSRVGSAAFSTAPVDEFAAGITYGVPDEVATISCDSELFFDAVNKVTYVCSEKSNKPVSAGVLFENDGKKLDIVTCDGVRAAHTVLPLPGEKYRMIVPAATLKFARTLGQAGQVAIYQDGKYAVIQSDEYIIRANLISGEFIDFKKIFKEIGRTPTVEADYILSTMQRCLIVADSDATISPTVLNFESGKIDIAVKTSSAEFNESVRCEGSVEPLMIGCNARYICDALKYCSDKKVTISAASSKHPIFVCDSSAEMLILPVMLKNKTD